jgi:hypothetical protein
LALLFGVSREFRPNLWAMRNMFKAKLENAATIAQDVPARAA